MKKPKRHLGKKLLKYSNQATTNSLKEKLTLHART